MHCYDFGACRRNEEATSNHCIYRELPLSLPTQKSVKRFGFPTGQLYSTYSPTLPLIWPLLAGGLPACLQLTRRFHVAAADGCRLPVAGCWLHWRWRWWCSWCSCCCVAFPFTICRMRWPFCRVRSRVVCSRVWPQMMMTATLAACWEHLPLTSSSFSSSRFSHLI